MSPESVIAMVTFNIEIPPEKVAAVHARAKEIAAERYTKRGEKITRGHAHEQEIIQNPLEFWEKAVGQRTDGCLMTIINEDLFGPTSSLTSLGIRDVTHTVNGEEEIMGEIDVTLTTPQYYERKHDLAPEESLIQEAIEHILNEHPSHQRIKDLLPPPDSDEIKVVALLRKAQHLISERYKKRENQYNTASLG